MKLKMTMLIVVAGATILSSRAASTWTGAVDNDLATAGNWNGGLSTTTQGIITNSVGPLALSSDLTMKEIDFNKSSGGDDCPAL